MEELKKFEVGQCYYTRANGDHNLIYAYQVTKRTAKTVILQDSRGKIIGRRKISVYQGCETVSPKGSYSMAPLICADNVLPGEGTLRDRIEAIYRKERGENEAERCRLMIRQRMKMMFDTLQSGKE
ncbi:MAG: hypothetical protein J6M62_04540 [Selenomonadaceae bacterium]|nr:hypothetical protein [Selenomonadaceae bacterium]